MKTSWTFIVLINFFANVATSAKNEKCEVELRPDCSLKKHFGGTIVDGKVKLKPIIVDGQPEAELINVQKIFFIEVR